MSDSFYSLSRDEQQEIREEIDDHDLTAHELGFPMPNIEGDEWGTDEDDE